MSDLRNLGNKPEVETTPNAPVPATASSQIGKSIRQVNEEKIQNKARELQIYTTSQKRMKIVFFTLLVVTILIAAAFAAYLIFFRPEPTVQDPSEPAQIPEVTMFSAEHYFDDVTPNAREGAEISSYVQSKYVGAVGSDENFVGMLTVPGTCIDTAVYRAEDNDRYIKSDLAGNYSRYGIIFMDYRCAINFETRNTIIYGHNFDDDKDGEADDLIFGDILQYLDVDFYKEHPTIHYESIHKNYDFKIIACFLTNGDYTGDTDGQYGYLFNYISTDMSDQCFLEYIDEVKQRSFINTTVDIQGDDKILTLSTCQYEWDVGGALQNARCVLIARMVRDGESTDVDVSGATQNENPRYPQLYYDIFGGENPYTDTEKWYPYL